MWSLYGLVWTSSQHGSLRQKVTQTYKAECSKRQAKWYTFYNQAFYFITLLFHNPLVEPVTEVPSFKGRDRLLSGSGILEEQGVEIPFAVIFIICDTFKKKQSSN